ncbi:MAG: hypothetical protein JKX72_12565 [Robiginitomaculum sp.]|nr:hypothetical protein [Robiginitomaculum sp.]
MSKDDPTIEELTKDLESFTEEAITLRTKADEAKSVVTMEKDKEKVPELQEAATAADVEATEAEEDVAQIKLKIEEVTAAADHGGAPGQVAQPPSTDTPVEGMPCTYRMLMNGPRIVFVPAVVKRVLTKPKGAKARGRVDLELLQAGKKPQTLKFIARGNEADTWSPIAE